MTMMMMMMMIQVVSFFSIALIHSSSPSISRWLPFRVWSTLILFLSIPFRHRKKNREGTKREAVQWWSHGNQYEPLRDLRVKTNETKMMMMTILSDVERERRIRGREREILKQEEQFFMRENSAMIAMTVARFLFKVSLLVFGSRDTSSSSFLLFFL